MAIVYVGNLLFIALTIFYQKSNSQARVLPLFTKKHFLKHIARSQSIHEVYIQLSFKFEFEKRRHGMPTAARRPTTGKQTTLGSVASQLRPKADKGKPTIFLGAWQADCGPKANNGKPTIFLGTWQKPTFCPKANNGKPTITVC